jgi:hypothetical protein
MIVYAFLYNSCIYESAFATMSLHKTRKGAEMAMEFHKAQKEKEHWEIYNRPDDYYTSPFGEHEAWIVDEIEVQDN